MEKQASVNTVQEAVRRAAEQAISAYCQGTFSVGGLLIDLSGNVLHALHNTVVQNNIAHDPTAHGERQLIDWYYENKEERNLPEPEEVIIVTSLDPCCMCTGSILKAGFKTAVIAANDTYAGINFDQTTTFPTLQGTDMLDKAEASFSYPHVDGSHCFSREQSGAELPDTFEETTIDEQTQALCTTLFDATASAVKETINKDVEPEELIDPADLQAGNPIYDALKAAYPRTLEYKAPNGVPDAGLAEYLIEAAEEDVRNGGEGNAVAFIDYFGNLLLCLPGNQGVSKIQTPFMLTTRTYAKIKYDLQMAGVENALNYLCHPKLGTFVYAKSQRIDELGLAELGAYGSTMEGPIPDRKQLQYVIPLETQEDLQAFIDRMPPLYSSEDAIHIRVNQVESQELIDAVQEGIPQ